MDLELELDDDLIAAVEHAATSAGITAEEWLRRAIMSYGNASSGPLRPRRTAEVADLDQEDHR